MKNTNLHINEYLVYARRSTDDLENQKNSIDYQLQICMRYAKKNSLMIANYSEEGFCEEGLVKERHTAFKTSGIKIRNDGNVIYKIERPKFQRLVTMLAHGKVKGIICLCWDRLSRNPHDDAIIKELNNSKDLCFVQATYDKSSSGALHMDIDGMFAAHHSRVTSEKVRAANAKLRSEGKTTNRAPIGYLDHGSDNNQLDPTKAPIIKHVFEKYASGQWSVAQLTNWAKKQGLTTKARREPRKRENTNAMTDENKRQVSFPAKPKTIEKILRNPYYAGFIVHHGQEMPGIHQPIISSSLFRKVQQVSNARCVSVQYIDKDFYAYRGLLRCTCTRAYSPYTKKGNNYYYVHCREHCLNPNKSLVEKSVHKAVWNRLGDLHFSEQELEEIQRHAPNELKNIKQRKDNKKEELEKQRLQIARDFNYLLENKISLLREGVYSMPDYSSEVISMEGRLEDIISEQITLETVADEEKLNTVLEFSELMNLAKQCYECAFDREKH